MKLVRTVVTMLLLGALFAPLQRAFAGTDGFYNLRETHGAWDGTDADREKAPSADYNYTYGDEANVSYTLPWSFSFYGQPYSQLNVDTNGNVWFTATGFANSFNLANSGRGPVISAWNDDLSSYFYGGAFIQHKTNPERVVIEWQAETYTEEGYYLPNDFELVLFPDGSARIDYKSFTTAYGKDFGSGISKGDGTAFLSITDAYGKAFTLAGRSFAFIIPPHIQIASPSGIGGSNTPVLNYTVSNGIVSSVKLDGAEVATSAGQPLPQVADGVHTLTVEASNQGTTSSATTTFTVDTTPPSIVVSGVADGGYYNATVIPVVTVTEVNPKSSTETLNGQTFLPGASVSAEGGYTLAITAVDQAGNAANVNVQFAIDKTPPVSTATVGNPYSTSGGVTTVGGQTEITLSAQDGGTQASGLGGIEYQLDNSLSWTPYVNPITLAGLADGAHTINYRAFDRAGNVEAPHALTVTLDGTPPVVTAAPAGGAYKSGQSVILTANEPGTIYYTTDGSTPGTSSAVYSQPIAVSQSGTIKYFAKDIIGNAGAVKSESYLIDSTPPVITLSTLADGAYTNTEPLNMAGTVTDDTGLSSFVVNGTAVPIGPNGSFSYALPLQTSANTITTIATDLAGNQSTDTRTITYDPTAPVLTINQPPDNSKTGTALAEATGSVDKPATVTVRVNGGSLESASMDGLNFTAPVQLVSGYNTIEITATDLAGNVSTQKRTVVYDDQNPSLAVTTPGQDIRTNQGSILVKGTASDPLTAVGIKIAKDGETLTPPLVNGTFQQVVTFTEEKPYTISVTATNEVGASTTVQRNVIYDITPPVIAIDAVTTPTNQPSQVVTGRREEGTSVAVTSATATIGQVSYPSATTWQVQVSDLKAGWNTIVATSSDAAGNEASATATITFEERAPDVTIAATPNLLWPPNHKMVPVTISGGVVAHGSDIDSVTISVTDQYGQYVYRDLRFGDTVQLEAWRNGNDKNGRIYTITAVARDKAGNVTTKTTTVVVPHDAGP